jgi:hypothetical protein
MIDDAGAADVRVLLRDLLVAKDGRCDLRKEFVPQWPSDNDSVNHAR